MSALGYLRSPRVAERIADADKAGSPVVSTYRRPVLSDDALRKKIDRSNPACPFYGLIGQDAAIEQLLPILVEAWRSESRAISLSLLFSGPPSTGKTAFARCFAGEHGLNNPFAETDGNQVDSTSDIFDLCKSVLGPVGVIQKGERNGMPFYVLNPVALFVDEFQALSKDTMNRILKALEPKDRTLYTDKEIVDFTNVLLIAATTERGDILKKQRALDSRFEKIEFFSYTLGEVAKIVQHDFPGWSTDDALAIAVRSCSIPREALNLAKKVERQLAVIKLKNSAATRLDALQVVAQQLGIDDHGVSNKHLTILTSLFRNPKGMNYSQLAGLLKCSVEELKQFVLPALLSDTPEKGPCVRWSGQRVYLCKQGIVELVNRKLIEPQEIAEVEED